MCNREQGRSGEWKGLYHSVKSRFLQPVAWVSSNEPSNQPTNEPKPTIPGEVPGDASYGEA